LHTAHPTRLHERYQLEAKTMAYIGDLLLSCRSCDISSAVWQGCRWKYGRRSNGCSWTTTLLLQCLPCIAVL